MCLLFIRYPKVCFDSVFDICYICIQTYYKFMSVKKILIFNDSMKSGGTEILLVDILNYLSKKEFDIVLVLPFRTDDNILLKDISSRVKIEYLHKKELNGFRKIFFYNVLAFCPGIYAKLKFNLNEFDLIVSFKDSPYSSVFCRTSRRKILWVHNLPIKRDYKVRSVKEWFSVALQKMKVKRYIRSFNKYDNIICVSRISKEKFIEVYNGGKINKGQKIDVLYNALDFNKISILADEQINISAGKCPEFIMVTRYSVEKRLDRVVNAANRLKKEGYSLKINIWGEGPYFPYIEKLVSDHSAQDVIDLKGYTANPYPYIKQADWLLCSSERESFGLVLLESIYLKTPVITTDCGGPGEIIDGGKYGVLTENTENGVYNGLKKVLDNPELSELYITKSDECIKRFDYNDWLVSIDKLFNAD